MARTRKVLNDHLPVAQSLEEWNRTYRTSGDPYVASLLADLKERQNLSMWATLNPMEFLPQPVLESGAKILTRTRRLTVFRNVLVFAPVALTWFAVGQATTAFSKYVASHGTDVVNFLDFWQNGYGVLAKEWTIGKVATLDFAIIALVIALTLFVSFEGKKGSDMQAAAEQKVDAARTKMAIELTAFLHDKQAVTNVTMNATLARALEKLLSATHGLEGAAKSLAQVTKKVPIAKPAESNSTSLDFNFDFPKIKLPKSPRVPRGK